MNDMYAVAYHLQVDGTPEAVKRLAFDLLDALHKVDPPVTDPEMGGAVRAAAGAGQLLTSAQVSSARAPVAMG
ncbi:MAG TPA: hypothetical protein VIU11_02220 [Nakamurella sp.]